MASLMDAVVTIDQEKALDLSIINLADDIYI